jgi:hypothetical protein
MEYPCVLAGCATVTEDATSQIDFASVIQDVANQIDWTVGCVPVTEDATSQTYKIVGCVSVTKDVAIQIDMTEFTDPFSTMTEGVDNLDYWSTYEEVEHLGFGRDMFLIIEIHPTDGEWDTTLIKREC